ncbi:MAG: TIGR03618 family F420-dependent PPOX class oxidoreductase [Propionibacteriaceae bacterium]
MSTLEEAAEIGRRDSGLAVVATTRADHTIQSSVVNAGILPHPVTGQDVLAFVTYGVNKLRNLRSRPQISVTFRAGWHWATVEGVAELVGPDDPNPAVTSDQLRLLLRDIFTAAGGSHDDWAAYDHTMLEQRRTAVLIEPTRIYSNAS